MRSLLHFGRACRYFIEEEMETLSVDLRAGAWPAELSTELLSVATLCVEAYKRRPKNMYVLVRPADKSRVRPQQCVGIVVTFG